MAQNVWMRSAHVGNACNVFRVNASGNVNNNNAYNGNRAAPDCERGHCQGGRAAPVLSAEGDAGSRRPVGESHELGGGMACRADHAACDGRDPRACRPISAPRPATSFEAIYESMEKCRRGVIWKDSVAHFCMNGVEECLKLSEQLEAGTYEPRPVRHFKVTRPRERDIVAIPFRDRVYQRSLNDNEVYPVCSKSFIHDNAACQKGKGTDFARERLKKMLRDHYRESGCDGAAVQFDVSGYYPNMRHDVGEAALARLPPDARERAVRALRFQYEGERGYNPGSQLVQIVGISVPNGIDHAAKERMHLRRYVRYMDDTVIVVKDMGEAREVLAWLAGEYRKIGFEPNPKKTKAFPLRQGIRFLGFDFRLTETGRVLMCARKSSVKDARRRYRGLSRLVGRGERTRECADQGYNGYRAHIAKGSGNGTLRRMDEYYEGLWR